MMLISFKNKYQKKIDNPQNKFVMIIIMKYLFVFAVMLLLGCGTIGGAISGAGDDIKKVGDLIKSD